jgi:hypothetical protein
MNINDYLEKLRAKPVQERERIAVIATGISFAIILLIWLISFSEITKEENSQSVFSPAQNQIEDLKKNMENDKQSIQEMMESLPFQNGALNNVSGENLPSEESEDQNQNMDDNQNNQEKVPSLP